MNHSDLRHTPPVLLKPLQDQKPNHVPPPPTPPPDPAFLLPRLHPLRPPRRPLQRHRPPQIRLRKHRRHQRRQTSRRQILRPRLHSRPPQIPPPHARRRLHPPPRWLPTLPPQQPTQLKTSPLLAPRGFCGDPRPHVSDLHWLQRRQRRRHLRRPDPRPLPLLHPSRHRLPPP